MRTTTTGYSWNRSHVLISKGGSPATSRQNLPARWTCLAAATPHLGGADGLTCQVDHSTDESASQAAGKCPNVLLTSGLFLHASAHVPVC